MREEVRDFTPDEAVLFALDHLEANGDYDNAERLYRSVLVVDPKHYQAMFRLGTILSTRKEYYEALYRLDRCCRMNRKDDLALSNKAMVLSVLGHHDEAIVDFEKSLALDPNNFMTLSNYGNTLEHVGRYHDALKALDKSVAIGAHADNIEVTHQNRGVVLYRLGRIEEAVKASTDALNVNPKYYEAQYNRGLGRLFLGDLKGGFEDCEAALNTPNVRKPMFGPFPHPQWTGENFKGATLLITGEQGLGDTIHFMRYLPYVLQRGDKVIVAVHELARSLYKPPAGVHMLAHGETSPPFDIQCPLMSLPHRLKMSEPPAPPLPLTWYAHDNHEFARWQERITPDHINVGLCWSGNGGHRHDIDRSIPVEKFAKLVKTPGIKFYGLQKEIRPPDAEALLGMPEIENLGPELRSFRDTAAVMENLDLMITVDTSVAHLSASLGIETWILLAAFGTDWRWQRERTDSPWYPTATLIRQEKRHDWDTTLAKVAKRLVEWNTKVAA